MQFTMNHSSQLSQRVNVMTYDQEDVTGGSGMYPGVTFRYCGPDSNKEQNPEFYVDVGFSFKKTAPLAHVGIGGSLSMAAGWTSYTPKYMMKACIQPLINASLKNDFTKNMPDMPNKANQIARLKKVRAFLESKPVPSDNYPDDFYDWLTEGSDYVHEHHYGKDLPRHSSNYEEGNFLHDVMSSVSMSLGNKVLDPILNSYKKLVGDDNFNTMLNDGKSNELLKSTSCFAMDSPMKSHILKQGWSKLCEGAE